MSRHHVRPDGAIIIRGGPVRFSARRGIVCGRGAFAWVFRGRTWGLSSLGSSLLV